MLMALLGMALLVPVDPAAGAPTGSGREGPFLHPVISGPLRPADLGRSWRPTCPVPPHDLRRLTVTHLDFGGRARRGSVIVHHAVVDDVLRFLRVALRTRFPIHQLGEARDAYGRDVSPERSDRILMRRNITSAFNCRRVANTTRWSWHAYGRALDVNPVQNPYASPSGWQPAAGIDYARHRRSKAGTLVAGDRLVRLLTSRGWGWGGFYSRPDWQHFDRPG